MVKPVAQGLVRFLNRSPAVAPVSGLSVKAEIGPESVHTASHAHLNSNPELSVKKSIFILRDIPAYTEFPVRAPHGKSPEQFGDFGA